MKQLSYKPFHLVAMSVVSRWVTFSLVLALTVTVFAPAEAIGGPRLISCNTGIGIEGDFVPSCFVMANGRHIGDPEISPDSRWMTWIISPKVTTDGIVLKRGAIVITPIDTGTGDIRLKKSAVFRRPGPAPLVLNGAVFGNGPEWALSERGLEVFYKAFTTDGESVRLGRISQNQNGRWRQTSVPNSRGDMIGTTSLNEYDPVPKIFFRTVTQAFPEVIKGDDGWREDLDAPVDHVIARRSGQGPFWMADAGEPTTRLLRTVRSKVGGETMLQVAIYHTETDEDELVSTKGRPVGFVFPWASPDGDAMFLATIEGDHGDVVEIYRKNSDDGAWEMWNSIGPADPEFPHVNSPEAFVHNGRAYISMLWMNKDKFSGPLGTSKDLSSIVTVASVDPPALPEERGLHRIVSGEVGGELISLKHDPETYVVRKSQEVRIIYQDFGAP